MLSIIIPTFNEEKYLPILLKSIKSQNFKEYEIIVADANSKDKTKQIAKQYGCKIIKGGIQSLGINNGARAAKYKNFLILDADSSLPNGFLAKNFNEFKKKDLEVASCFIKSRDGNFFDNISHIISNIWYFSTKNIAPFVPSFCFFIKKDFFNKVGGFDEKVPWFIDLAFSNALPNTTKYNLLPVQVLLSVRMAKRLGRFKQARILISISILRLIKKNSYAKYKY